MTRKQQTHAINGQDYIVPELSLEQVEHIFDLIDRTGLMDGSIENLDALLGKPISDMLQMLGKKKLLREFLATVLVKKDEEWKVEDLESHMAELGKISMKKVLEVGQDFLSVNEELWGSFANSSLLSLARNNQEATLSVQQDMPESK